MKSFLKIAFVSIIIQVAFCNEKHRAALYPNEGGRGCGGVVLNEWYILSNAFCTHGYVSSPKKLVAHIGITYRPLDEVQTRVIDKIKIPTDFDPLEKHHDIALVRTSEKIQFTSNIQPINLPQNVQIGVPLIHYNSNSQFNPSKSDLTSVVAMNECVDLYRRSHWIDFNESNIGDDFICVENKGIVGLGVEGNPLIANGQIFGVASWKGDANLPRVFTKVFSYKHWIEANAVAPISKREFLKNLFNKVV